MTRPELNLLYVHSTALGYARYGVKLAQELERCGVDVYDSLDEDAKWQQAEWVDPTLRIDIPARPDTKICDTVCWISTPGHCKGWYEGQHRVLSTMWEATVLPEAFRENLHHFDQVIVPSDHNLELFSRYHPDVRKVPLGVDTKEWRQVDRTPPQDRFNFLIGGSGTRKGTDLAYRAFRRVFKTWPADGPVPWLIFKSPKPEDFYGERIERIGGRIPDDAERALYASAHCYLQPSRGEGWGLQPLQALATGMPTILTDAHGHAEFAKLGVPLSATLAKSDYFIYGDAGQWWEPSLDELCDAMDDVYRRYDFHLARARRNATIVRDVFSWHNCAENFLRAVGNLRSPYSGTGAWETPTPRRYLVRTTRHWRAEVAGDVLLFSPGRDYFETADVKRILFESEVLDPSCVVTSASGEVQENELGLSPEQLARVPDYSAAHSFCWTCGQKLGSGVRAFDDT